MHTPAPPDTQTALAVHLPLPLSFRRSKAGFSLIEVTLAIAVVAFSFVALIGLLPAGMSIFNQTMDSTNEMRITTDLTSMLQSAEYSKIPTDPDIVGNIFYYDVDGVLLDTETRQIARYQDSRIYAARIIIDKQNVPQRNEAFYDEPSTALRALVLVSRYNPSALTELKKPQKAEDVHQVPRQKVRVLPLVITKTDGQR
jgi:uncharacterized protein (TIGR02598 family)